MALLISDKKVFQTKSITKDEEEISKIIKSPINEKDIAILSVYETYNK